VYTVASRVSVQLTGFGAGTEYAAPVWSADGTAPAIVTPATLGAVRTLYVEKVGTNAPIPISRARSHLGTYAWSPDSTQIAYLADEDTLSSFTSPELAGMAGTSCRGRSLIPRRG
jgi:hypothetical protein